MISKQDFHGYLVHASYLMADEDSRIAAVVDPPWDIEQYLAERVSPGLFCTASCSMGARPRDCLTNRLLRSYFHTVRTEHYRTGRHHAIEALAPHRSISIFREPTFSKNCARSVSHSEEVESNGLILAGKKLRQDEKDRYAQRALRCGHNDKTIHAHRERKRDAGGGRSRRAGRCDDTPVVRGK